jgi:thymidylate synthase ThyX
VRFTESADLLNLRHKHAMRLCYNAQEEIWRASVEEALQIREVHPLIGSYLLPPCGLRESAATKPYCPEGDRYVFGGVPGGKTKDAVKGAAVGAVAGGVLGAVLHKDQVTLKEGREFDVMVVAPAVKETTK